VLIDTFQGDQSVVYGNDVGLKYLVVSEAAGYQKTFTIVKATKFGAFADSFFNPLSASSLKALPPASSKRRLMSRSKSVSLAKDDSTALRSSSSDNSFEFMCWVFNEKKRRFVAWGSNDEVRLVKPRDITVWLAMTSLDVLASGANTELSGSQFFVYSNYPDKPMDCVGTGMPVMVNISSPDMYDSDVTGVHYYFYSNYPNNYLGCRGWTVANQTNGASCGILVKHFQGPAGYIWAGQSYLIIAVKDGYYTGYSLAYMGIGGYSVTWRMMTEMSTGQERVVLRWGHSQDLDLWVYSSDFVTKIGRTDTTYTSGPETITLDVHDVHVTSGPGLETTSFQSLTGTREVWVRHFDDSFRKGDVASYPATLDIYCDDCYYNPSPIACADDDGTCGGKQYSGYVTTVAQMTTGLENPVQWWKAGHFVNIAGVIRWQTCKLDCWAVFPGAGEVVAVSMSAKNMITGQSISGASFEVYMNYVEPYTGCIGTTGDSDFACGRLVATSNDGSPFDIPKDEHYLVVGRINGYYTSYVKMFVSGAGMTFTSEFVQEMALDQNRVVLHWSHTQDLDLWAYNGYDLNKKVGWSQSSATLAGGTVRLDVDNWSGLYGPETTQFQSLKDGVTMVWVHHYDTTYKNPQVQDYPASVYIFCYDCTFEGAGKAGYVTTVTQRASDVPFPGVKWWKVGQYVSAGGSVTWETCKGQSCYTIAPAGLAPLVTVSFSSEDAADTSNSVSGVTYTVYKDYPEAYQNCTSCGTHVAQGASVNMQGDEFYLVKAELSGYYTVYYEMYAGLSSSTESIKMVKTMAVGQNRVLLRWGHTADLDLWVVNGDDRNQISYWSNLGDSIAMGSGSVTLDKNVLSGPGIETTQFNDLDGGQIEVWVDYYGGRHVESRATEFPASVDVYCDSCVYNTATYKGYVTTVTQNPSNLASGGRRYWNVGHFAASTAEGVVAFVCRCGLLHKHRSD